jgi:ADP-ribose pyrophosphatase
MKFTILTEQNYSQVISRPKPHLHRPANAELKYHGELFYFWQWPQQLFDGSQATFESLSRADTVTVIALDEKQQLLITKQRQPNTNPFIGFAGGIMDEGEQIWPAAKRELLEETGYTSDEWYFMFAASPSGKIDWVNFYLLAKNCQLKQAQNLDAGEQITVEKWPLDKMTELVIRDDFRDRDFALWWLKKKVNGEEVEF